MKQLLSVIALTLALSAGAFAHGGNEHVRGTVTSIEADLITVQLADKSTKVLRIDAKTEFENAAGKPTKLSAIKAGDRVVIDVPEHKSNALLIKVGAAKK